MKRISTARFRLMIAVGLLALGGVAGIAQHQIARQDNGRPAVRVQIAGTVSRDDNQVALDRAASVNPGETLNWTITSVNEGAGAARNYAVVGQIPRGTVLVAGSTVADAQPRVTYSVDNGQSYSEQPTVEERQADGSMRRVPAPVSSYTQVRYEWSDPLAAGATFDASYRVRVR